MNAPITLPRRKAGTARNLVNHICDVVQDVQRKLTDPRVSPPITVNEAIEVAVFSTLGRFDGVGLVLGPFAVRPITTRNKQGKDIAGELHSIFAREMRRRNGGAA